ncbi:MAG: VWA domain-containing protein [Bdellovibrionota bacterium]|nr:VWA domain-containing protein [Bdellovibrionota bacterium]
MATFTNDPQFTAYALGELEETQKEEFRARLLKEGISEEEIQQEVDHILDFKNRLGEEFSKDDSLRLAPEKREEVLKPIQSKSIWDWFSIKKLAPLFVFVIALPVIFFQFRERAVDRLTKINDGVFEGADSWVGQLNERSEAPKRKVLAKAESRGSLAKKSKVSASPEIAAGSAQSLAFKGGTHFSIADSQVVNDREAFNREGYDHVESNSYVSVQAEPLSTFSIDVDTASYANVRRFLENGSLPPKHSIRVEELINYFPYDLKMDHSDHPISVKVDQAESPFHQGRRLVRVAMKAQMPKLKAQKNLVFLLDVSGSMNATNKLPLLKESLKILLRELEPTDTISLVVYAGAAGVVLEPTPAKDRVKILSALNRLNAGGSTNGGAGIEAAYKLAKEAFKEGGVNRVILATDGDFNIGTSHRGGLVDMVKEKAKENIFLTVLGFGMGNYQDGMLEELSNKGNGNYAYIDNLSEANKVFKHDLEKNMTTVAKDVKIQVEFNPQYVQAYRLIGYENRTLAAKDFNDDKKDAGEIGAGHTVTALYEVVGVDEKMPLAKIDDLKYGKKVVVKDNDSNEILNVKVRYKKPEGTFSTKFEVPLKNAPQSELKGDRELLFATSVAAFGMKLRGDEMTKNVSFKDIREWAKNSKGKDELNLRGEFIDLIDFATSLKK